MNWKYYCENYLPAVLGVLIGGYFLWHNPEQRKSLFGWLEPQAQSEVRSAPTKPLQSVIIPEAQPQKFKPFRPKPLEPETAQTPPPQKFKPFQPKLLTLEESNNLLRAGKYQQLATILKRDQLTAKGADINRINNMLKGLERFLPPPSAQTALAQDGTFRLANSASSSLPRGQKPQRVIALGGGKNNWMSAVAYDSPYSQQQVIIQSSFPSAMIELAWKEDFRITSIGGSMGEWGVVLSHYKDKRVPKQTYWGPGEPGEIMESWIAAKHREGMHITAIAGLGNQWVIVMSGSTGWGKQRFTRPGALRNEWIAERAKEGYILSAAAGGVTNLPENPTADSYMFVVTQGSTFSSYTLWPRAEQEKFQSWFDKQKKTNSPIAFFGDKATSGAALVQGLTYGVSCGHYLKVSSAQTIDWLNKIGVGAAE
jgi:hypothetical protein